VISRLIASSWALRTLAPALILAAVLVVSGMPRTHSAEALESSYLMCGRTVEYRTQSVYVDPSIAAAGVSRADMLGAFWSWNRLFLKYHGFPIFAEHTGPKSTADIVIDATTYDTTWVDGVCRPGYVSAGWSHTTIYLGAKDSWRNGGMLAHELGHALGLADHGGDAQHAPGHIGYQPCSNYLGVMSYCASWQTWFLDYEIAGLYLDGQLVRDYWR